MLRRAGRDQLLLVLLALESLTRRIDNGPLAVAAGSAREVGELAFATCVETCGGLVLSGGSERIAEIHMARPATKWAAAQQTRVGCRFIAVLVRVHCNVNV